jgi:hypothetical protein
MKPSQITGSLALGSIAQACGYPTREIAGITVIDTPIVRAAEQYARERSTDTLYAHVMRSWLYGVLAISANEGQSAPVDMEVHAVGALLHDLGWDKTPNSTIISPDRRFEVDGAIAAREFIRSHPDGRNWDEARVQRVWDAIALHTEQSIVPYKELDVRVIPRGVNMDFFGPDIGGVTAEAYAEVGKAFPKVDFHKSVNESMIWLCQTKPASTYGEIRSQARLPSERELTREERLVAAALGRQLCTRVLG